MGKTLFQWWLVGCIACMGCSSSGIDNGGGGAGGSGAAGGSGPISFDADNALSASSANVIALATTAQLGVTVSAVLGALAEAPAAADNGVGLKQDPGGFPLSGLLCPGGGTAILSPYPSGPVDTDVTLTFTDCAGTAFSGASINGTIVLTIEAVSGIVPSEGTAVADLTGGGTSIDGTFKVLGSFSGGTIELFLGDQRDTDLLTITTANGKIELACFKIRVEITLGGALLAFEPLGVVRINDGPVYTLNDYTETPPIITFSGLVATSGSAESSSGDGSTATIRPQTPPNASCGPFGQAAPGDSSILTNDFMGNSCVMVEVVDAGGTTTSYETTWDKLLAGDTTPGGGTCSTEAEAGPPSCDFGTPPPQGDLVAFADTYIRGSGPEGDFTGDNYGAAGNLLIKTVSNQAFNRKIYIVFNLPDDLDPESFEKASLVLTLQRHIFLPDRDPSINGPQPTNVYGITDRIDWDGLVPPEVDEATTAGLSWSNAPKNITADPDESQFASDGVELLISNYTFDLGLPPDDRPDPGSGDDPPAVTRYSLDVTKYITDRLDDTDDEDKVINILLAIQLPDFRNVDGSAFLSKETAEQCHRPFLHFE